MSGHRTKGVGWRAFRAPGSPGFMKAPQAGLVPLDVKGGVNQREQGSRSQQVQNNYSEGSPFACLVCIHIRATEPYIVETGSY